MIIKEKCNRQCNWTVCDNKNFMILIPLEIFYDNFDYKNI